MNGVEFSESPSSSLVLCAFQVLHSPLWATQCGKLPPSILDVLKPMDLELDIQRGPLIGGFLHPYCYGVPGKVDTCRALRQQFYVPTSVFAEDGLITLSAEPTSLPIYLEKARSEVEPAVYEAAMREDGFAGDLEADDLEAGGRCSGRRP